MVKTKDLLTWATLIAMLLGAGIWLGRLQQELSDLHKVNTYLHGHIEVPR